VWDYFVANEGLVPAKTIAKVVDDDAAGAVLHASWARAIRVNGRPTPMFGTRQLKGRIDFVVIDGRAPSGPSEIAFAPQTANDLGVRVGGVVRAGPGRGHPLRVVGIALLPVTSHTDYDKSAWVTAATLRRLSPPAGSVGTDFVEDYVLVRFRNGADVAAAQQRLSKADPGGYPSPAVLPTAVVSLGDLRALPFALAVFFALLASATVAHALVTTVRRRAPDLAILRSIGFTRRDARVAIAWQSTLLAIVGLLIGVPLGIIAGRLVWKQLAENFPVVYVPPLALVGVLLVVPVAIAVANALAAGPAYAATRLRPAEVLRTE
jgi:ABC-type antimicrobial peptide transport system permease subunit